MARRSNSKFQPKAKDTTQPPEIRLVSAVQCAAYILDDTFEAKTEIQSCKIAPMIWLDDFQIELTRQPYYTW